MKYAYALIAPALMLASPAAAQEASAHAEPVSISLDRRVVESNTDLERRMRHIQVRVERACDSGGLSAEDRKFERLCETRLTADVLAQVGDAALTRFAQARGLVADDAS